MQLEQLATPVSVDSPHRRYATLHRALESGIASDATWREMTEVCLVLGHRDEALLSCQRIREPRIRRDAEHLLQRHGLLTRSADGEQADEMPHTVKEDVLDATRVLFEDHMPLTTIVTTMTFPIVVGLGGFLTSTTSSSFLFPAIAALPALCVAAVVGGMSRRILIDAARGLQDPPRIPQLRELSTQSGRFLLDALVLTLVLLGPAIALGCVQGLSVSTLVATMLGAFLLPGAMAIRQLTNDWRALSPNCLFTTITRLRGDYAATAGVCTLVAAPAALSTILTAGSHLYLQASVVGPLAVAPLFFASRLLGLMVHGNRRILRDLLAPRVQPASTKVATSALRPAAAQGDPTQPWGGDLARPTLRTTTATPPRVAAVPRTPVPDRGPLPTSAPRPALKAEARPAARREVRAVAPPVGAAAAAPIRPAHEAPLHQGLPQHGLPPQGSPLRGRALPPVQPAPAPHAATQPAGTQPGGARPGARPVARTAAARPAALSEASAASPVAARELGTHSTAAARRPLGGTHRAVGQSQRPAPTPVPEPHPLPATATQQVGTKPRVAVTETAPPDFTQLPGFNVVTGAARVLSGAAARAGGKRR